MEYGDITQYVGKLFLETQHEFAKMQQEMANLIASHRAKDKRISELEELCRTLKLNSLSQGSQQDG